MRRKKPQNLWKNQVTFLKALRIRFFIKSKKLTYAAQVFHKLISRRVCTVYYMCTMSTRRHLGDDKKTNWTRVKFNPNQYPCKYLKMTLPITQSGSLVDVIEMTCDTSSHYRTPVKEFCHQALSRIPSESPVNFSQLLKYHFAKYDR